ncbi:MAG: hypothetical protein M1826_002087 [Phylliscum demangeonii]|nr:MAG: hypothetical protein M1826_002087 [Phylliscum demangeonii]
MSTLVEHDLDDGTVALAWAPGEGRGRVPRRRTNDGGHDDEKGGGASVADGGREIPAPEGSHGEVDPLRSTARRRPARKQRRIRLERARRTIGRIATHARSTTTSTTSPRPARRPRPDKDDHDGWWSRIKARYGGLELKNEGSVARDHLALERTFLAWLRTSLSFASIGIGIVQLFRLNLSLSSGLGPPSAPSSSPSAAPSATGAVTATATATGGGGGAASYANKAQRLSQLGRPIGITFVAVSIVVLLVGMHRYYESQHWIIRGKFPASRASVCVVALFAGVMIVGSMVVLLVVDPVLEKAEGG